MDNVLFLKRHYDLSGGTFDISDILSASEPVTLINSAIKIPADSSMIAYWNDAITEFTIKRIKIKTADNTVLAKCGA